MEKWGILKTCPSETLDNVLIQFLGRSVHSLTANGARSAGTSRATSGIASAHCAVVEMRMVMTVFGSVFTFIGSTLSSFGSDSIRSINSNAMESLKIIQFFVNKISC